MRKLEADSAQNGDDDDGRGLLVVIVLVLVVALPMLAFSGAIFIMWLMSVIPPDFWAWF